MSESLPKYTINHNIDGWPICKDGEPIFSNKTMLAELQQLQSHCAELEAKCRGIELHRGELLRSIAGALAIIKHGSPLGGEPLESDSELLNQISDVMGELAALKEEMRAEPESLPNLLRINREYASRLAAENAALREGIKAAYFEAFDDAYYRATRDKCDERDFGTEPIPQQEQQQKSWEDSDAAKAHQLAQSEGE